MAGMIKVQAIGNLGNDVEVRVTKAGTPVANFRMACNVGRGEEERTEWLGVACFGKTAELAARYLKKGSPVYVDGRLQTREWKTKEGEKRTSNDVVVENLVFIGASKDAATAHATVAAGPAQQVTADDIPF